MAEPSPTQPALHGLAFFIDQALPQTQCTRCGYPDCASYAQAIATDGAPINQCAPGGAEGVQRLAAITGQPALPLNRSFGVEGPLTVARIDEAWCIGCTLCIKACPTDAILGANKHMHTVITAHCTGCELCLPVCPVDCIELDVVSSGSATGWQAWSPELADHARSRYGARHQRLTSQRSTTARRAPTAAATATTTAALQPGIQAAPATVTSASNSAAATQGSPTASASPAAPAVDPKKAAIAAALAKARALRAPSAAAPSASGKLPKQ